MPLYPPPSPPPPLPPPARTAACGPPGASRAPRCGLGSGGRGGGRAFCEAQGEGHARPHGILLAGQEGLSRLGPHEALQEAKDSLAVLVGEGHRGTGRASLLPDRHDLPGRDALEVAPLIPFLPLLVVPLDPQALPGTVGKVARMEGLDPSHGSRVGGLDVLEAHVELVADAEDGRVSLEAVEGDNELRHVRLAEADVERLQRHVLLRLLGLHVSVLEVHAVGPVTIARGDDAIEARSSLPPGLHRLPDGERLRSRALLDGEGHAREAEQAEDGVV
eukprot:768812-Hanusia_phi.AAC.3